MGIGCQVTGIRTQHPIPITHHPIDVPVVVDDLHLRYPETGRVVLRGVNLRLEQGEVKLLLGPSGAGKSSLALTMNGLIPHRLEGEIRGAVLIYGQSTQAAELPELTSKVGIVFQDPEAQIASLTVVDEVAFGLENLLVPPEGMPERIRDALRRVGMTGMETAATDALSGGQKQRLALASTLAMGVSVLVFDEPTANLDPAGTSDFFSLIGKLKAEGATILIIEHKLDELIAQVDSVDVLDWSGTIVASGPPRQIFSSESRLLDELGLWVPQVVELAYALRDKGIALNPYPLTVEEAAQALRESQVPSPKSQVPSPKAIGNNPAPLTKQDGEIAGHTTQLAVEAENLSYAYPDGTVALNNASMNVAKGDFYALVGPNGSGKTTLARHLIGLMKVQKGELRILGEPVTELASDELNRRVGYVFQNPEHQFVTLKVYDELAFSLRARKMPEDEVRALVEPLLKEFGLDEYTQANPFSLSQGQKRRLSVATMLALDPQVLILDEPTFGQDRDNTVRIMQHLRRLNERGITIIIITHDMKLVADYADRVGVLIDGHMEYEGPVRGLYERPALLERARLQAPPIYLLSQKLRESDPTFPLLMRVDEFVEEICARSGMSQATASFTV